MENIYEDLSTAMVFGSLVFLKRAFTSEISLLTIWQHSDFSKPSQIF